MALKVPGLAGGYKPSAPRASVSHLSGGSALAVPEAKLFAAQNDAQDAQAVFKAGQGIVAEGAFDESRTFRARQVLAKHDETYMPREVADRLKAQGEWRPEAGGAQTAAGA